MIKHISVHFAKPINANLTLGLMSNLHELLFGVSDSSNGGARYLSRRTAEEEKLEEDIER